MKKFLLLLGFVSFPALADVRIISVQPRYSTTYQQECRQVQVTTNNSGIGTVIGGVAGGIIGNQVGGGSGKDIATVAGAVVGGMVGNRIGSDQQNVETKQECYNVPVTVQRGETVTFEYKGRRFQQVFE
jgi:uncharacterized protein YcfJ